MNVQAPEERMFFLIGRGRSGTTLLRGILDAHPDVSVPPEALFVLNLYRGYRGATWDERTRRNFARDVFLEDRMRRWKVDRGELEKRLSLVEGTGFPRMCAEVYAAHAAASGKGEPRLLGDKNPHYALFVRELAEIFPRAKFVHVVRDYRDNIVSYRNVPFDVSSTAALAYRWRRYNEAILDAAARAPIQYHLLKFEDLVADPQSTLDALCRFLGIELHEAMLRAHESGSAPRVPWHKHAQGPIDAQRAGQWREALTPAQIALADRICQPLGTRFGYLPEQPVSPRRIPSPGEAYGWAVTQLERAVFLLPVSLQSRIIRTYRRLTGNVIQ